jgi:hypothetical protein
MIIMAIEISAVVISAFLPDHFEANLRAKQPCCFSLSCFQYRMTFQIQNETQPQPQQQTIAFITSHHITSQHQQTLC